MVNSMVNVIQLTREELEERYSNVQKVKHKSIKKVTQQSAFINKMIGEKGVNVSEDQLELLKNIIENHELKTMIIRPISFTEPAKRICIKK